MSGSAALSAAKNRRTASAPPSPSSYNSTQKNDNVTSKQVEGPKNPLQILYVHEIRLNKLEQLYSENDKQSNDKQSNDKQSNDKQSNDKQINNKNINDGIIKALTDKIILLEKQSLILKEELSKIMSFAMETNRAFLLYKNNNQKELPQQTQLESL